MQDGSNLLSGRTAGVTFKNKYCIVAEIPVLLNNCCYCGNTAGNVAELPVVWQISHCYCCRTAVIVAELIML